MSRKYVNNPDNFCYIGGEVTFASRKCLITQTIKKAYFLYIGCKVGNQDKKWAPHVWCTTCSFKLNAWVNGKGRCMLFGVPMVWSVPSNHSTDRYFCMVPLFKMVCPWRKSTLVYPNIPSPIQHVLHGDGLPVPEPPDNFAMYSDDEDSVSSNQFSLCFMATDFLFLNLRTNLLCTLMTKTVFLQTAKNSSHQLQEMQTTFQAQTPPNIESQKAISMTSSGISNFHKIRQNVWHQG